MESVSPVIPGLEKHERVVAKDQPEYSIIHVLVGKEPEVRFYTRFKLSDEERQALIDGADLFIFQLTFGHLYQPTAPFVGSLEDMAAIAPAIGQELGFTEVKK